MKITVVNYNVSSHYHIVTKRNVFSNNDYRSCVC